MTEFRELNTRSMINRMGHGRCMEPVWIWDTLEKTYIKVAEVRVVTADDVAAFPDASYPAEGSVVLLPAFEPLVSLTEGDPE